MDFCPDEIEALVATLIPTFWESFELVMPYTQSRRIHYHGTSGWKSEQMTVG